ncbi:Fatty acid-binding -like protein 3 [Trichinella pseudospiralis]|uniref:Fatty acid-binding-like protein 3 n=2 Tax=Trichinella pseudospiralis TaxID=6337 RepID=A0A0V1FMG7_TRIPS|nr:Fatty acid-binding -like protein 3 [Trichinella pseudospiralis]KRY68018.1 Fatty acid-binding -like protein 3 [Trichinella pseudospiralis]KRY87093.1 Fatty acid-binding -like protein 3 [Trichinella pseudospiralis]KRZ23410.1 Fatty acid-binding -like protein 3 [Trichinella pseudospiralis]
MERFLGKYHGVGTENMDEYFKARGMVWPLRKMILSMMDPKNAKREFSEMGDGSFTYKDIGSTRTPVNWSFRLGETFTSTSYDGKQHKILFEFDPSGLKLLEKHEIVDEPESQQIYEHYLDNGQLIWVLKIKDTSAKWFYVREQ